MWTPLRKKLEDNLPDCLKGHIAFHMAGYTDGTMAHDKGHQWSTITICHDKKIVLRTYLYFDYLYNESSSWKRCHPKKGRYFDTDHFFKAYDDYMSKKHEETAFVDDPYFRMFALLDRRTGKRTLQKYVDSGEYGKAKRKGPKELAALYEIRLAAEGFRLKGKTDEQKGAFTFHPWDDETDGSKAAGDKEEKCALPSPGWPTSPEEMDDLVPDIWLPYAAEMGEISQHAIRHYLAGGSRAVLDLYCLNCDMHSMYEDVFAKADPEMAKACMHKWISNGFDELPKRVKKSYCCSVDVYYTGLKGRFVIAFLGFSGNKYYLSFVDEFTITRKGNRMWIVPLNVQGLELSEYKWPPTITPTEYEKMMTGKKK